MLNMYEEVYSVLRGKRPFVLTHRRPDVDALSSAYVVANKFNGFIAFEDKPDRSAQVLAERLGIEWYGLEEAKPPFIVVDSSSKILVRLDSYEDVVLVIDHHRDNENSFRGMFEYKNENAQSTAELVAEFFGFNLSRDEAFALACGIYTDTNLFYAAEDRSIDLFYKLWKMSGYSFKEVVEVGYPKRDLSEMNAYAEGMNRLMYVEINGYGVVFTVVNSMTGSLANMLSKIFDLVFVLSWDEDERATRVSARASLYVDVDLSSFMFKVGKRFNGGGGGHKKASGALCFAQPKEVISYLKEQLQSLFG